VNIALEVRKAGKLPAGRTEIPFEFPLRNKAALELYETYHGVFVNIQVSGAGAGICFFALVFADCF
jgi:hypothetical protein